MQHISKFLPHTYAFLTTKGFRIDSIGHTAEEAYEKIKDTPESEISGKVTKRYFIYDKDGLASVYAPTFELQ